MIKTYPEYSDPQLIHPPLTADAFLREEPGEDEDDDEEEEDDEDEDEDGDEDEDDDENGDDGYSE